MSPKPLSLPSIICKLFCEQCSLFPTVMTFLESGCFIRRDVLFVGMFMRSQHPTWHKVDAQEPFKGKGEEKSRALRCSVRDLRGRSCPPPQAKPAPLAPRCCACATTQRQCSFHRAGAPEVLSAARARKEQSGVETV